MGVLLSNNKTEKLAQMLGKCIDELLLLKKKDLIALWWTNKLNTDFFY